jgi:hypothetical protein
MATFKKTLVAFFSIIGCSIGLLCVIIFQYNRSYNDGSNWIRHTLIVVNESSQVLSTLQVLDPDGMPEPIAPRLLLIWVSRLHNAGR